MKFLILVLALLNVNDGKSPCAVQPKIEYLLFEEQYCVYDTGPIEDLLQYSIVKKDVENVFDVESGKLHCSIKELCSTKYKKDFLINGSCTSFCKLYFIYEYKKKIIFTINRFEFLFFSSKNLIIDSNQIFQNSNIVFFTKR